MLKESRTALYNYLFKLATGRDGTNDEFVWVWFITLSVISVFNICVYLWQLRKFVQKPEKILTKVESSYFVFDQKKVRRYQWFHMIMSSFFVFQCAVRSFFPEIYNTRHTFFDHWMNSCFIGRALATIGEVTWIAQMAATLVWCHEELNHLLKVLKPEKKVEKLYFIYAFAISSVVICCLAECFCNYAMFTLHYYANVIETTLWTVAIGSLLPYAMWVFRQAYRFRHSDKVDVSAIIDFSFLTVVINSCFVAHLAFDHIPYQHRLFSESNQVQKVYMTLKEGFFSSIYDRKQTQAWEDWKDEWFWMAAYFSTAVWFCLLMQNAPRVKLRPAQKTKNHSFNKQPKKNGKQTASKSNAKVDKKAKLE